MEIWEGVENIRMSAKWFILLMLIGLMPMSVNAVDEIPDYDFDKNYDALIGDNMSIPDMAETLPLTFTDVMGTFFWGLFFGMIFIVAWIRQDDVTNISIAGIVLSGVIFTMLPAVWLHAAYALVIVSFGGLMVSWIFKK